MEANAFWILLGGGVLMGICGLLLIIRTLSISPLIGIVAFIIPPIGVLYAVANADKFKDILIGYVLSILLMTVGYFNLPKNAQEAFASGLTGEQSKDVDGSSADRTPRDEPRGVRPPSDQPKGGAPRPVTKSDELAASKGDERRPSAKGSEKRIVSTSNPSDVATLSVPELIEQLKDKSVQVRTRAIFELGRRGREATAAAAALEELTDDPQVGQAAKFALKKIQNPE